MIRNYFKTGLRNLLKRKGYNGLNIIGLTIGIVSCLLIFQYVSHERNYDKFQKNASRIVRIRLDQYKNGRLMWQSATSYPAIGPEIKRAYPEVEDFCRIKDDALLLSTRRGNTAFSETKGYYADPSSISILGVKLIRGTDITALAEPDQIIISQSMARKYFGTDDVVGKVLIASRQNSTETLQINGVFQDYPDNSHLVISYLVSYSTLEKEIILTGDRTDPANKSFGWYDFYTYLQLKPGTDLQKFQSGLPDFADQHINSLSYNLANNVKNWLYIIPLSEIHLHSNYNQEAEINGNGDVINFLFIIALIILGIAWINYINLSTARSVERAKEVGVRKVLGAGKLTLVKQFMLENGLLNLTAIILATILVAVLTPLFNRMMGEDLTSGFHMSGEYWLIFLVVFTIGTFLSGLYPAFVLSDYKPLIVLKGAFKNSSRGLALRKSLIVFQFGISVVLIIGTFIVYQQVAFMRNQKLGVNINQTLILNGVQSIADSAYPGLLRSFKSELLKNPDIRSMSASSGIMGREIYWTSGYKIMNQNDIGVVTMYRMDVDYDFVPQFELQMLAGRNFSRDFSSDSKAVVLNEKAAGLLGFRNAEDAIGKKIMGWDTLTVVGVMQNFHHLGLQKPIDPQIIALMPNARTYFSVKVQTANVQHTITGIQALWKQYFPGDPFNYTFLNDQFNAQYQGDQRFGQIFTLFSSLAIFIACLGLTGLSSYNILQRTKEVGIRKVLGASTSRIVYILSKDFLFLVLIAFIIAMPVSWLIMQRWLENFAYKVHISWWVFGGACLLTFVIAFGTISYQVIKAALMNPANVMKIE